MTDELRDALRAKHRLVEQMKEDVARPDDRRSARRAPFWQMVTVVAAVLFLSLAAAGGAAAEKATRASRRAAAAERRALERREVKRWSSERALRHFGLRESQIAFTDPVRTSDALHDSGSRPRHARRRRARLPLHRHGPQTNQRRRRSDVGGPSHPRRTVLTMAGRRRALLTEDVRRGPLAVPSPAGSTRASSCLRDPRVVVPVFKALETAVENGRLVSPIILDAEVLPELPSAYRRGRACALTPPRTRISTSARRPGSVARGERRARAPRDPSTWTTGRDSPSRRRTARATSCRSIPRLVRSAATIPPMLRRTAVANRSFACPLEKISPPRKKNPAAGLAFLFQSAYAWHQRQRAMMHQRLRGAKVKMLATPPTDEGYAAATSRRPLRARARGERSRGAALAAANATSSVAAVLGKSGVGRRRPAQMDFEIMAIAEAEREGFPIQRRALPPRRETYDRRARRGASLTTARTDGTRARTRAGSPDGTWEGDVLFPVAACALPTRRRRRSGSLARTRRRASRVLDRRARPRAVHRGDAGGDAERAGRVARGSGVGSRAVARGERPTERQIFVDPVVAHPEEALESNEAEEALEEAAMELERTTRARRRN